MVWNISWDSHFYCFEIYVKRRSLGDFPWWEYIMKPPHHSKPSSSSKISEKGPPHHVIESSSSDGILILFFFVFILKVGMLMLGAFTVCVDIIVGRISCVSGVCSVRRTLLKKPRLPGVAILDEEDPDPPHHCPRCDRYCSCVMGWIYSIMFKTQWWIRKLQRIASCCGIITNIRIQYYSRSCPLVYVRMCVNTTSRCTWLWKILILLDFCKWTSVSN